MTLHGIELSSPEIKAYCRKWKVSRLDVFGSILRSDFNPESDVDFLVDFEGSAEWDIPDVLDMRAELEGIVGRQVDLITRYALETDSNPYFRRSVRVRTELVYAA